MKNKILLFATLVVLTASLGSCAVGRQHRASTDNTTAPNRSEQDHMHDNDP